MFALFSRLFRRLKLSRVRANEAQVFVAYDRCGCAVAADSTGRDCVEWLELGYSIAIHDGPVILPSCLHKPQSANAKSFRPSLTAEKSTNV